MDGAWIIKLLLLLGTLYFCFSVDRTEEDDRWVLEQMRNRFNAFRLNQQFAVLYIPPPNNPRRTMTYLPSPNWRNLPNRVLYPPMITAGQAYEHNYATATPDDNAAEYGTMLGGRDHTIHTEDLFINLVLPRQLEWYNRRFNHDPRRIYLFTHFLPCPDCYLLIRQFQLAHPHITLVIGYTNLFMGREATIQARRTATLTRRNNLNRLLDQRRGRLLQLATIAGGVCAQRGHWRGNAKRDVGTFGTCPAVTSDREFIITMDFATGKAVVMFAGITPDYNGWVGLYDGEDLLTWEWTKKITTGRIVFDEYLYEHPYEVRYHRLRSKSSPSLVTSFKWENCGFSYRKLNLVPSTYGDVKIKLTMYDGYPTIYIRSDKFDHFSTSDWVAIQTYDQIGTQNYWAWQWVSKMYWTSNPNIRYYRSTKALNSYTANGFRAKYVSYSYSLGKYIWEGNYDNVSPTWTSETCSGTL